MGTSVSHRSPDTPNWRAVSLAYKYDSVPIKRAVEEIWRAATNQPDANLAVDLGTPIIARCLSIVVNSVTREEAVFNASREIALSRQVSLASDIALRALVQSFASAEDRVSAFTKSLFAEASNYLVSRDLSGYIGREGRARTVKESIELKNQIRDQITQIVISVPHPTDLVKETSWHNYVADVVSHLSGKS